MSRGRDPKWAKMEKRIGKNWLWARTKSKMSLRQVCDRLKEKGFDILPTAMSRLERGVSQPENIQVLMLHLCVLYSQSPNTILTRKEDPYA